MRDFPQKKRDKFNLSITQAIANDPITQKHKDTHKKSIPVGSKANTGTKGFTAIVNTGENTNSENLCSPVLFSDNRVNSDIQPTKN